MSLVSLSDYRPMPRYDGKAWIGAQIQTSTTSDGPWSITATIIFDEPDADPAKPVERSFTIPLEDPLVTWLRVVFIDDDGEQDVTTPVSTTETPTELAAVRDVALRLGRWLTDAEEVQVTKLISFATANILNAVDKDVTWEPPTAVKSLLSMLCVELVCRAMANPQALGQKAESLGAYSNTITYPREIPGSGIMLTEVEELMIRRAVWGQNGGSSEAGRSEADTAIENGYYYDRAPMVWIQ